MPTEILHEMLKKREKSAFLVTSLNVAKVLLQI